MDRADNGPRTADHPLSFFLAVDRDLFSQTKIEYLCLPTRRNDDIGGFNIAVDDIAGVCDATGLVFGLMPHPERHVVRFQHPEWTRQEKKTTDPVGLQFFKSAVNFAERLS
jgi:hypothetical protein